jgi:hypothetical protein
LPNNHFSASAVFGGGKDNKLGKDMGFHIYGHTPTANACEAACAEAKVFVFLLSTNIASRALILFFSALSSRGMTSTKAKIGQICVCSETMVAISIKKSRINSSFGSGEWKPTDEQGHVSGFNYQLLKQTNAKLKTTEDLPVLEVVGYALNSGGKYLL